MTELSDIAAAQQGNREALERVLRDHLDVIHRTCLRVLLNPEDAKDAAQQALINIATRIDSFDGRSSFSTWVYRISTNAALDEARRRSRRSTTGLNADLSDTADEYGFVDERDRVDRLLARLPEDQRVALTLREVQELDYSAIAEILNVPIGTVRSRIARARNSLIHMELESPSDRQRSGES